MLNLIFREYQNFTKVKYTHDWTWTTGYSGTVNSPFEFSASPPPVAPELLTIDTVLLQPPYPIDWHADVLLFEDELHDCGESHFTVKAVFSYLYYFIIQRAMPECWFILCRFWLRVDGLFMHSVICYFRGYIKSKGYTLFS